jgi:hypothetical protein
MIEAFWSQTHVELLDRHRCKTRLELANAIFEYLEIFYNRTRRHSALGMLTRYSSRTPPPWHENPASRLHETRAQQSAENAGEPHSLTSTRRHTTVGSPLASWLHLLEPDNQSSEISGSPVSVFADQPPVVLAPRNQGAPLMPPTVAAMQVPIPHQSGCRVRYTVFLDRPKKSPSWTPRRPGTRTQGGLDGDSKEPKISLPV